jgi:hypothetical protein
MATGTSQYHPERSRVIQVRKDSRLGRAWSLTRDTYFDALSFTTRIPPQGECRYVPAGFLDDLLDLLCECHEQCTLKHEPELLTFAEAVTIARGGDPTEA